MTRRKKVNYHLIYCFIIGLLIGYIARPQPKQKNDKIEIKMNVIKDSVVLDTIKIKTLTHTSNKTLPLNEKNLKKVLKANNIKHPNIVLAQAKLETGNFTSKVCKSKSNLFGLRKGNQYRRYWHWTESVKAYKKLIQSRYTGGDYLAFLNRIGYAKDPTYIDKLQTIL